MAARAAMNECVVAQSVVGGGGLFRKGVPCVIFFIFIYFFFSRRPMTTRVYDTGRVASVADAIVQYAKGNAVSFTPEVNPGACLLSCLSNEALMRLLLLY